MSEIMQIIIIICYSIIWYKIGYYFGKDKTIIKIRKCIKGDQIIIEKGREILVSLYDIADKKND